MCSKTNNNKKSTESTTLKVAEAEQRDVGRKIARVDPEVAKTFKHYKRRCIRTIIFREKNYCS